MYVRGDVQTNNGQIYNKMLLTDGKTDDVDDNGLDDVRLELAVVTGKGVLRALTTAACRAGPR